MTLEALSEDLKDHVEHVVNCAIFAQMYLDQQLRKQKAVPRARRDERWQKRQTMLDEAEASIDYVLMDAEPNYVALATARLAI